MTFPPAGDFILLFPPPRSASSLVMEKGEAQKPLKIKNKIFKKNKWVQKYDGRKGLNDNVKMWMNVYFKVSNARIIKRMNNTNNEWVQ